jgi:hypothetical protein
VAVADDNRRTGVHALQSAWRWDGVVTEYGSFVNVPWGTSGDYAGLWVKF